MLSKLPGARCSECPLQHCGRAVPGSVPSVPSGLAIVGDFPSGADVARGAPLLGQAGVELDKGLVRVGAGREWRAGALVTTAIACRPARRLTPKELKTAVEACAPRLALELDAWKASGPSAIALAGKAALLAATGKREIMSWVGGVWEGARPPAFEGPTLIPIFSPTMVGYEPKYRGVFRIHLARVLSAARGKLSYAWPEIIIGRRDGFDAVRAGLSRVAARVHSGHLLGFDVETAGIRISDALVDFGLAVVDPRGPEAGDLAVTFDWRAAPDDVKDAGRAIVRGARTLVLQNGQFDGLVSETHAGFGIDKWDDTMHAHQIVAPLQKHSLGFIAATELPHPRWKDEFKALGDELWTRDDKAVARAEYNAKDAWVTARIWPALSARLDERPGARAAYGRLLEEAKLAKKMRKAGLAVDLAARDKHAAVYLTKIEAATARVRTVATAAGFPDFNPRSGPQTIAVFEALGAPASTRTELGTPRYDKAELSRIVLRGGPAGELAAAELDRDGYEKRYGTYVRDLHAYLDPDGRMRASWSPGLVSGRWSASDPGIHQMPKALRDMFVAGPGRVLVGFDLGQIEPRCLGVLSGDPAYRAATESGLLYETLAAKMFRRQVAEVSKAERQMAKKVNLAVSYGAGAAKLEASLKPDFPSFNQSQAEALKRDFFKAFPGIKRFQAETIAAIERDGALIDPDTALLYPMPDGPDHAAASNQPIQVAATWTMRQIVAEIDAALSWPDEAIVVFLHDELILEVPESRRDWALELCTDVATRERSLRGCKFRPVADVRWGKSWGAMESA